MEVRDFSFVIVRFLCANVISRENTKHTIRLELQGRSQSKVCHLFICVFVCFVFIGNSQNWLLESQTLGHMRLKEIPKE